MFRKTGCIVLLGFVLIGVPLLNNMRVLAQPRTWTVDDDGGADFTKIQDAINAAAFGDSVFVKSGVYYENVVVNKSVSLIGESKKSTAVNTLGVGTAFTIISDNVNITNFTVLNTGRIWGPPIGQGCPDSCVLAKSVLKVRVEDNVLTDAAVGVWISSSSFVSVVGNIVIGAVYAGIIGYASSNISIQQNNVERCGLMGIHLDAGSVNSDISDNRLTSNLEGLELEDRSTANRIERNTFSSNNVSIVLNNAGSALASNRNIFRNNNMSGNQYNLIVIGLSVDSFMQNIDSSNLVDGRKVYYLINLHYRSVDPLDYPNLGYLALINSTGVRVSELSFLGNGDGVLLAYSKDCTLTNLTISGNRGPLIWGGLTLYNSHTNTISYSRFSNNSYGLAFYHSASNSLFRNSFISNERQVISDFAGPFSNQSSGHYSRNAWDDGFFRGNYWSDYRGIDADRDGVGDTPYFIDISNLDYYPLILVELKPDTTAPLISISSPRELASPGYIVRASSFTIVWYSWDEISGVAYYEIRLDDGVWKNVSFMTTNNTFAEATFTDLSDGLHTIDIKAVDTAGNVRQERYEFTVDTLFFRVATVVIIVAAVVAVCAVLFSLRRRFIPRGRKAPHRLVR